METRPTLRRPDWRRSFGAPRSLDGFFADLFRADANRVFDWEDENFAVADLAGFRSAHDKVNGFFDHLVGQHDCDFHFRKKIKRVLATTIDLRVALLAAEALGIGNGHPLDTEL